MENEYNLTEEQFEIVKSIISWASKEIKTDLWYQKPIRIENNSDNKYISLSGYAGTGKSFLIPIIAFELKKIYDNNLNIAFVAFTGKASNVIKNKINDFENKFNKNVFIQGQDKDFIGTIHSLIYTPVYEWDDDLKISIIKGWSRVPILHDFVIIDEASMIPENILNDLFQSKVPILFIGDHGQLPPVEDDKTKWNGYNILQKSDFRLTKILRQKETSEIILLSEFVRKEGFIPYGVMSQSVFKLKWSSEKCKELFNLTSIEDNIAILCGFNKTRINLNRMIREKYEFKEGYIYPGEKLICLKNNPTTKLMNGQTGTLLQFIPKGDGYMDVTLEIDGSSENKIYLDTMTNLNFCFDKIKYFDDIESFRWLMKTQKKELKRKYKNIFQKMQSLDFFDFGYAFSVHKSQGSQFKKVVLIEERSNYWDDEYYSKWLYTAITRAEEKLFVIGEFRIW